MKEKINKYINLWKNRGYGEDIPDEVPTVLMRANKAPSYQAICLAILKNDAPCKSLGFTPKVSPVYRELKRIEIEARNNK